MFKISPKRGTIFDRRNRELAVSINVESVYAVPSEITDKPRTAARLAQTLGLDPESVRRRLEGARSFCWIKRKVDYPQIEKVRGLQLPGIYFETESKRYYPKRELAAHVLGYVGMDNEGLAGLEHLYERAVRGTAGRILLHRDARKRYFSSVERPPTAGSDLVLTMDESIQYLVEQELSAQVKKSRARGGTAIVMNPASGAILAMANLPTFNPNHYGRYSEATWRNQAILNIYEPGSTFKVFTAATALEERLTSPEEQIHCMNGGIVIGRHRIRDHKPFGWLSVRDVIARSSNVGIIQLGFRIGKERLERYLRLYGFGRPTQVDLPGEARGLLAFGLGLAHGDAGDHFHGAGNWRDSPADDRGSGSDRQRGPLGPPPCGRANSIGSGFRESFGFRGGGQEGPAERDGRHRQGHDEPSGVCRKRAGRLG